MNKPRILIVEDEGVVAMDIEEALQSLSYAVVGTTGIGEEVPNLVETLKPDLILMDIHLAGKLDGIETAELISQKYSLPIVFLTAFADKPTLDRAKMVEPYGYVLKPFRQIELRTVIELALHKHATSKARASETRAPASDRSATAVIPDFRRVTRLDAPPSSQMQVTIRSYLEANTPWLDLGGDFLTAMAAVCHPIE